MWKRKGKRRRSSKLQRSELRSRSFVIEILSLIALFAVIAETIMRHVVAVVVAAVVVAVVAAVVAAVAGGLGSINQRRFPGVNFECGGGKIFDGVHVHVEILDGG